MTAPPRLYPRAFLLTASSRELPPAVHASKRYSLGKYTLHAEELTEVDIARRGDRWVAVVGKAWPLSTGSIPSDTESVASSLLAMLDTSNNLDAVDEALYDLGGRYAVLVNKNGSVAAYNDACGNRSVFFSTSTDEISSHFALIRQGLPDKSLAPLQGDDHREDLSWERTRSPHIQALVPNHRALLQTGKQYRYFPLQPNRAATLTSDERLKLAGDLWSEQLARILATPAPKLMSITAGLDSRTMLALAYNHVDSFKTYTYTSDEAVSGVTPSTYWSQSGANDLKGINVLRPFLPADHLVISIPAERAQDEAQIWISEHNDTLARNSVRSHNRRLLPRYLEHFPDPTSIHYRGNLLEIGRLHFRTPNGSRASAFDAIVSRIAKAAKLDVTAALEDAAESSLRLEYDKVPLDYDLTDIFYWEQRHGRWFAQVLNESDVAFDTVTPFNVRRIIDLLLAYPIKDRAIGFAQNELIYRSVPLLTFAGINGEPDLYRKFVSNGIRD